MKRTFRRLNHAKKKRNLSRRRNSTKYFVGGKPDKMNVEKFVEHFHKWLTSYDMCFLSGAYVLEDPTHLFYNIFSHGEYSTNCFHDNAFSEHVHSHMTTTHKAFEDDPFEIDNICGPKDVNFKSLYKLERIFSKPLEFLCETADDNNKEPKRVALFYPFVKKGNPDEPYLFLKFEEHPMNSLGHVEALLNQARHNTFPMRRENSNKASYISGVLEQKDTDFYKKFGDEAYKKLVKYNSEFRHGHELFLSKELLDNFLDYYTKNAGDSHEPTELVKGGKKRNRKRISRK